MLAVYVVLVVMIIGAIIAVECRDLLSSVVAVGMVGLGLSLVCLMLHAPDVAITQLVVEIFAIIILMRATVRRNLPDSPAIRRPFGGAMAVALSAVVLGFVIMALADLPSLGEPHARVAERYLESGLKETGAPNLVTAVLLDYRAYDTLGEATVLFTAVVGVLAVLRKQGRRESREERHEPS